MNFDLGKKIKVLDVLSDHSLSMTSLSDHKWMIHSYANDTPLGNSPFYGETLEETLDKTLKETINVKDTI